MLHGAEDPGGECTQASVRGNQLCPPLPAKGIRVEETLQEMLEPFLLPWQAVLQMLSTGQRGLEGEMSKGPVTSEQDKPKASVIA